MAKSFIIATSLAVCMSSMPAQADLVLDLRLDDTTRSRSVSSGSSVFVDMFLVDTDGTSAMSGFGAGLINGGGKIVASGTAGAAGSFSSAGTGFTGSSSAPVAGLDIPGIASASVAAPFTFPIPSFVPSGIPGAGVTTLATAIATEVLLARFSVTATGTSGNSVVLTADRLGTISGVLNNGNTASGFPPTALDGLAGFISSGGTESVTLSISTAAVPEPSSFLVSGLAAVAFVINRRRRRCLQRSTLVGGLQESE